MNKPNLRDRRRQKARDALYRAQERRDKIIDALVRNTNQIKNLQRALARLNMVAVNTISVLPVSVAEGKLLEPVEPVSANSPDDDISDISWAEMTGADLCK